MDKKEFSLFAMALRTYYPKENILPNQQAMELWYREVQDLPYPVAEAALRKWVSTNKWSPSIAEIREAAAGIQNGALLEWSEAWEQVRDAIWKYGSYEPGKALASMDPLTRKVVKQLGFRNLCVSENPAADRANFRQCYEIMAKREQTQQQISLPLRDLIEKLGSGSDGMLKLGGKKQ